MIKRQRLGYVRVDRDVRERASVKERFDANNGAHQHFIRNQTITQYRVEGDFGRFNDAESGKKYQEILRFAKLVPMLSWFN